LLERCIGGPPKKVGRIFGPRRGRSCSTIFRGWNFCARSFPDCGGACRAGKSTRPDPFGRQWRNDNDDQTGKTAAVASVSLRVAEARPYHTAAADAGEYKWHSTRPPSSAVGNGAISAQCGMASGQRGWNGQPAGGSSGLGNAVPRWASGTPSPGSGVSTDKSSARV